MHCSIINSLAQGSKSKVKVKVQWKVVKMFLHKEIGGYLSYPRPHCYELTQLCFEYYFAWLMIDNPLSHVLILDSKDIMFQANPFPLLTEYLDNILMFFEESNIKKTQKLLVVVRGS